MGNIRDIRTANKIIAVIMSFAARRYLPWQEN